MIRMAELELGGAKWSLNTLGTTKGLEVLFWLGAIIGQPAGEAGGLVLGGLEGEISGEALGRSIGALTGKLADPRTIACVKILLAEVRRDGKPIVFDQYFAGNYGELSQLVTWAVTENFESFFRENPALTGLLQKAKALAASHQATSTGESGE